MLTERRTHTTIPASDVERAVRWYDEKLGFKPKRRLEGAALYEASGGGRFVLYPTANAGKAPQTVIGFATPDIDAEVRELKARGVVFEEYDYPTLKTVGSIAKTGSIRAAWFRDSEGNILGVAQVPEW